MSQETDLRERIKEWIALHDQLAEGRKSMKLIRDRFKVVEKSVIDIMQTRDLDVCKLSDGTGGVQKKTNVRKAGLKMDAVKDVLGKCLSTNSSLLTEVNEELNKAIETTMSTSLKRKK